VKDLYELLTSPDTEITNFILTNVDGISVSWKLSEDNTAKGKHIDLAVSNY